MLSFKTPWKRSPQNHAKPARLKEKGLRGCFHTCETTASLRCHGVGETNHNLLAWSGFCQRCIYSAEKKAQSLGRYKPKKPCIWEVWLWCSGLSPLWTQTSLGHDKTSKELPSNLFLLLSPFLQTSHSRLLICDEKLVLNRTSLCKR